MRRIVVTVVIAATILISGAAPALAHTVAGTGATNFKTTLEKKPSIDGLSVKVIEAGSRIQASYTGASKDPIYVLGYEGEKYLRIESHGVWENLKSPATYINKTRNGVSPPGNADSRATPEWHKISSGHIARWHDHRIHFMGGINPVAVRNAPGQRHVIVPDWQVTFVQGTTTAMAQGSLVWVPGPSPAPMLLLALVLGAGAIIAARRAAYGTVAIATGVLVLIDIAHSLAIGFANAGTTAEKLGRTFSGATVSIPAWIVGLGAVWFLAHKRVDGFFAAVFCGLIVAVVGGLADNTVLSRSQVPFALSAGIARPIVAASLGLGVGVAVASGLAIRKLEPRLKFTDDDEQ